MSTKEIAMDIERNRPISGLENDPNLRRLVGKLIGNPTGNSIVGKWKSSRGDSLLWFTFRNDGTFSTNVFSGGEYTNKGTFSFDNGNLSLDDGDDTYNVRAMVNEDRLEIYFPNGASAQYVRNDY